MIRRRDFVTLLGGAAAAWPVVVRAQQAGKLPTIGFLGSNALTWTAWTAAFVERLGALGWVEGRTIVIDYRWSEGRPERVAEVAAEFVRLKVDAIVTDAIAVPALKQATAGRVYRGGMTPSEFQAHLLEQVKDILSKLSIFR